MWEVIGGITTLFVIVVVLNNYQGTANILTSFGNLYAVAVGAAKSALPFPNAK